jgi:hypothetical protein
MLIESIIRRKNGTDVSLDKELYRFEPKPLVTQGDTVAHVCSVNKQSDIDTLLSIVEGFRPYKGGVERKPMAEDELTGMLTLGLRKIKPEIALMSATELDMVEEMETMGAKRQTLFDYISLERQKRLNNGIPI